MTVEIVADAEAVSRRAADRFADLAAEAIVDRGRFMAALSGGSTPRRVYELLSGRVDEASRAVSRRIDWPKVHLFFGDERYVPHDHAESNFRMAREALLDHVPLPAAQVHGIPTNEADPNIAAERYADTLREQFGLAAGAWPSFDLVYLGLGPDGHTASLFPGTPAVYESQRLAMAVWVEKFATHRITLTPPVLCAARQVMFLVEGTGKAQTLHDVLEGPRQPDVLPAQVVRPDPGTLTWLVDQAASSRLSTR
jgi:6-phosphogluconolactonase